MFGKHQTVPVGLARRVSNKRYPDLMRQDQLLQHVKEEGFDLMPVVDAVGYNRHRNPTHSDRDLKLPD